MLRSMEMPDKDQDETSVRDGDVDWVRDRARVADRDK